MASDDRLRRGLLDALLELVSADPYPSSTMLDMVEAIIRPEELPVYFEVLLEKVRRDHFPSIPMLSRLQNLC